MSDRAQIAMGALQHGILSREEARCVLLNELGIEPEVAVCASGTEDSAVSVRSLFAEDVEVVEFSQDGQWDDAAVLRKIAEYVEESGRTPYSITYTNDEDAQVFTAYLHA